MCLLIFTRIKLPYRGMHSHRIRINELFAIVTTVDPQETNMK